MRKHTERTQLVLTPDQKNMLKFHNIVVYINKVVYLYSVESNKAETNN